MIPEVSPSVLKSELDGGADIYLLDVRESHELDISALPGIVHIPLGEVETRFEEVPKDANIVVICRSGKRSAMTTEFLLGHGYTNVRNLESGMNGWASTIDSSMKIY